MRLFLRANWNLIFLNISHNYIDNEGLQVLCRSRWTNLRHISAEPREVNGKRPQYMNPFICVKLYNLMSKLSIFDMGSNSMKQV